MLYIYHSSEIGNPISVPWNENILMFVSDTIRHSLFCYVCREGFFIMSKYFNTDTWFKIRVKLEIRFLCFEISFTKKYIRLAFSVKCFHLKTIQTSAIKALILLIAIEQGGAFSIATSHIIKDNLSHKEVYKSHTKIVISFSTF